MECWFLCKSNKECNWFTFSKDGEYKHQNYGICWMFKNCPKIADPNQDMRSVTGHKDCRYTWGE